MNIINKSKLEEMCEHISKREQLSQKAQRDSIKYKQVEYLLDKVGNVFNGIVSGITEWGMYVELIDNKCEGMIKYQSLDGKWSIDTNKHTITDSNGYKIRLGDKVKVVINKVDIEKKQIDFRIF